MTRRNTLQKALILDAVRTLRCHASADEVYDFVRRSHPSIGKGTVYRNLCILANTGEITRVEIPNGPDRFDHDCTPHFHARCELCGRILDLEPDTVPDLTHSIRDAHGMKILGYSLLFKGICPDCRKGDPSHE